MRFESMACCFVKHNSYEFVRSLGILEVLYIILNSIVVASSSLCLLENGWSRWLWQAPFVMSLVLVC
jgi:hypothetical protein